MTVKNIHGQQAIDSREVAEMVERNHKELLRDIRKYIEIMEKANERNFAPVDFFIESSYKDSKGETRPCYLITKKGCDMIVANSLRTEGAGFGTDTNVAALITRGGVKELSLMSKYELARQILLSLCGMLS